MTTASSKPPSRDEIVALISACAFPDPASAAPDVPTGLAELCRLAMSAAPDAQPSGRELQQRLQDLASDPSMDDRIPGR